MNKWSYKIQKAYKTGMRVAVQVRFSDGENFFYKTFPIETAAQLESVEMMCEDEISRITELYAAVEKFPVK